MAFDDPFNSDSPNLDNVENNGNNFYNFNDEDPAAEFLEREKRELADITGDNDINSFNDPFNADPLNDNENNYLSNDSPTPTNQSNGAPQYEAFSQMNEPETIRKWREEFTSRIEKKDTEEETKRKELREQAKKELDDFYKQRTEQLDRTKGQNRSNNHTYEDDLFKNGNSTNGKVNDWDKITNLCEFNPKTNRSQKDLTRYRSVLLQLKQQQTNTK